MTGRLRVLIGDDDADMRSWLKGLLQGAGVAVDEADDGEQLLWAMGDRGPYSLVVTDVHMPTLDGRHVVAMARGAELGTPFLMISADAALESFPRRFRRVSFLAKPFDKAQLLAAITRTLDDGAEAVGDDEAEEDVDSEDLAAAYDEAR